MSDADMTALQNAQAVEASKLFLTQMIAHHEGAITMVKELFSSKGAGQDEIVFRFATDVEADQIAEFDPAFVRQSVHYLLVH